MAPPVLPASATGPVCFFQSQPITKTVFQWSFNIAISLIVISVAVQLYDKSKIEKYRGRSRFNKRLGVGIL